MYPAAANQCAADPTVCLTPTPVFPVPPGRCLQAGEIPFWAELCTRSLFGALKFSRHNLALYPASVQLESSQLEQDTCCP
jgi:hypothetical protein